MLFKPIHRAFSPGIIIFAYKQAEACSFTDRSFRAKHCVVRLPERHKCKSAGPQPALESSINKVLKAQ